MHINHWLLSFHKKKYILVFQSFRKAQNIFWMSSIIGYKRPTLFHSSAYTSYIRAVVLFKMAIKRNDMHSPCAVHLIFFSKDILTRLNLNIIVRNIMRWIIKFITPIIRFPNGREIVFFIQWQSYRYNEYIMMFYF